MESGTASPSDRLDRAATPDVDADLLVVPIGATEQHGPHLPMGADSLIAEAVARLIASAPRVMLAPTLAYGASGEHEDFVGTVSVGTDALRFLLVELARSATRWSRRVVFVNGHGGNVDALVEAATLLRYEGRDVAWMPCAGHVGARDAHAGHHESSLLLHLHADLVQLDRVQIGNIAPINDLLPALRAHGVRVVAPNGVLGDPRGANAVTGRALFEDIRAAASARVAAWVPDSRGMLILPGLE